MRLFDETVEHGFAHTLGWLRQWACSRSFGLGTRLPWDPEFLIESLSDSTLYMAYYTVAHILQQGDMYGEATGGVRPEDVTAARNPPFTCYHSRSLHTRAAMLGVCGDAGCALASV